jgi:hypothetical protein
MECSIKSGPKQVIVKFVLYTKKVLFYRKTGKVFKIGKLKKFIIKSLKINKL